MTKKKKPARKKKPSKPKAVYDNWVDRIDFVYIEDDDGEDDENALDVRVISFNVLAQAYLSRRSHRDLPRPFEDVVFSPKRRQALLKRTLQQLVSKDVDILCLQEVDLQLVDETLVEENFRGISTPTTNGGGAGSRVDSCCIYWNNEEWELVEQDLINFDDLASLGSNATELVSNLHGVKQSLLKRNVGIMARLQHKRTSTKIVILNCHLYWNPQYDYVKLCQAHYAMERTKVFSNGDPIVVCGDFNSQPSGPVHHYLTKGKVNAKEAAPWYNMQRDDGVENIIEAASPPDDAAKLTSQLDGLEINTTRPQIRYLLDFTLNRFTRWLRILGIDAELETEEEEIQRTSERNIVIFERCREEGRTLITTSSKLMQRRDCPPGTYLINPKTLQTLEACLVHLLLSHGVVLEPAKFLSRCVVCNGNICRVTEMEEKKRIFTSHQAPELWTELECFECDGCGQGYWWCENPNSSASRVKVQATHLFELCLRSGVEIKGPLNMFDFLDVEAEREKEPNLPWELEKLQVLDWLKQDELFCPIQLESSYALRDDDSNIVGECKPFTNVTSDFVGFLDYVLFEPSHFQLRGRLYLPSSFLDLNKKAQLRNGHLLPSYVWPSDHLAVGSQLRIKTQALAKSTSTTASAAEDYVDPAFFCGVVVETPEATDTPTTHKPRCGCGCVPPVLSMFEMAALRKQARLRAQKKKLESQTEE